MQVIKTKKGTFYREKVYVEGKAHHSPRFTRKSDATNWKARMLSEKSNYRSTGIMPKVFLPEDSLSLAEYAELWLETRVTLQLSGRTYEHYGHVVRFHLLPRFGHLKLIELKLTHSDQLIKILTERGHNARGINNIVGIFKRILIEAVKENRLEKNPLQYLREMKEPPRPDIYLSGEQINRVLEANRRSYFYSLFLVAVNTGMRRGELAGLCWDKVSFERNFIEVTRLRDRSGLSDRTKTVKSRRFIPMNAVVRGHLLELKESSLSDYVFVDNNGAPFDVNHLYREFEKALNNAQIKEHFRFHDLRHTFASHFMMNGGNIYDLQKIMGHTSLEMTQRYAHLAPEHLLKAANVVSFGANFVTDKANKLLIV
jgi:integrase